VHIHVVHVALRHSDGDHPRDRVVRLDEGGRLLRVLDRKRLRSRVVDALESARFGAGVVDIRVQHVRSRKLQFGPARRLAGGDGDLASREDVARAGDGELGPAGELAGVLVRLTVVFTLVAIAVRGVLGQGPVFCARDGAVLNAPRARDRPQREERNVAVAILHELALRQLVGLLGLGIHADHTLLARGEAARLAALNACGLDLLLAHLHRVVGEALHRVGRAVLALLGGRVASQGHNLVLLGGRRRLRWRRRRHRRHRRRHRRPRRGRRIRRGRRRRRRGRRHVADRLEVHIHVVQVAVWHSDGDHPRDRVVGLDQGGRLVRIVDRKRLRSRVVGPGESASFGAGVVNRHRQHLRSRELHLIPARRLAGDDGDLAN